MGDRADGQTVVAKHRAPPVADVCLRAVGALRLECVALQ